MHRLFCRGGQATRLTGHSSANHRAALLIGHASANHRALSVLSRGIHVTAGVSQSFYDKYIGPKAVVASESFKSRWLMALPAVTAHLCIGAPYAWSAMAGPLSREYGFVCSSADDWTMAQVAMPMSVLFFLHGTSAALLGKWQMKVGPRTSIALAGLCFGGGFGLSGLGVYMHNLPLIYLGFGVLSGTGLGLAYTPPIQALIEWFPDRKGVASGLTIMGFGSGGLFFVPASNYFMEKFAKMPVYLGEQLATVSKDGKLFADIDGALKEVIYANATDLSKLSFTQLTEGYYLVGTGSTGATATLLAMGGIYTGMMTLAAFGLKRPHPSYRPEGYTPPTGQVGGWNVHVDDVMKTPQFYCLATTLFCIASGGMGLISVCKPLMSDTFGGLFPGLVTAAFASTYVMILSVGNLGGRIGWGVLSDYIGRRATFHMFTVGCTGLYLSFPWLIGYIADTRAVLPLAAFCVTTSLAISFMGGTYAILPAYESDLFGSKYVGANHGRMLLASSAAAIMGPSMILYLRNIGEKSAISDLLTHVDPAKFHAKFGVGIEQVDQLIAAKTVTISKLMELVPQHIQDPTPYMYNTSFYAMASLMGVSALAHAMVKPVNPSYYETVVAEEVPKPDEPATEEAVKTKVD